MENHHHHHHHHQHQQEANQDADMIRSLHSPNSTSSSGSSSSSNANSNGAAAAPPAAPLTPKSVPKSIDSSPYPTTFVQADTSSFKQVVQMLTGSAGTAAKRAAAAVTPHKNQLPPAAKATGPKKPAFKLYERRNSLRNLKMISPLMPSFLNSHAARSPMGSPARLQQLQPEILSPSVLDFPSLALSPVTPLITDPFNRTPHAGNSAPSSASAQDRAIANKGFYLHPSPRSAEPPRLLPLFPEISSRLAAASAAATT